MNIWCISVKQLQHGQILELCSISGREYAFGKPEVRLCPQCRLETTSEAPLQSGSSVQGSQTENGQRSPCVSSKGETQPDVETFPTDDQAEPCHHWQGEHKGQLQVVLLENINFFSLLFWTSSCSDHSRLLHRVYRSTELGWKWKHHLHRIAICQFCQFCCH